MKKFPLIFFYTKYSMSTLILAGTNIYKCKVKFRSLRNVFYFKQLKKFIQNLKIEIT